MRGARREHVSSLYRRRRLVEVASVAAALWPEPPHCGRRAPLSPRVEPANEWCYSRLRPELRGMRTSRPKGSARPYVLHRAAPARGTQPHHLAAGRSALRAGLVEEHRAEAASDVTVLPRRQVTAEAGARGREPPTEARPQHQCTESDTAWHHEEEGQHKDGERARCCKIQHVGAIHADVHDQCSGASHDQATHALQNGVWPTRHPP